MREEQDEINKHCSVKSVQFKLDDNPVSNFTRKINFSQIKINIIRTLQKINFRESRWK